MIKEASGYRFDCDGRLTNKMSPKFRPLKKLEVEDGFTAAQQTNFLTIVVTPNNCLKIDLIQGYLGELRRSVANEICLLYLRRLSRTKLRNNSPNLQRAFVEEEPSFSSRTTRRS